MRRRDILALFAGALASRPLPATAQPGDRVRVIGVLIGLTEKDPENPLRIANFERGLRDLGWIDGRNLRIHYRFGADADRLQASARELLALQPAIIVASSSFVVFELLRLTQTIPIVFVTAADPMATALFRASRAQAAMSPASPAITSRWAANGWNCSWKSHRTPTGSQSCSTQLQLPAAELISSPRSNPRRVRSR